MSQNALLIDQLEKALPRGVFNSVHYVYERLYWDGIDVVFRRHDGTFKVITVPTDYWLNDEWIARLCLEAP